MDAAVYSMLEQEWRAGDPDQSTPASGRVTIRVRFCPDRPAPLSGIRLIPVRAEADRAGKLLAVGGLDVEHDALTLAKGAKDAALEAAWLQHHLERSTSRTTMPMPVVGSYTLTTP